MLAACATEPTPATIPVAASTTPSVATAAAVTPAPAATAAAPTTAVMAAKSAPEVHPLGECQKNDRRHHTYLKCLLTTTAYSN